MNECYFVGNLVKDPEKKVVTSKDKEYTLAQFTIAVNGKSEKDTSYIDCTAWDTRANMVLDMLSKGDTVFVSGALHNARYKKKDDNWVLKSDLLVTKFLKIAKAEKKEEKEEIPFDFPNGI